MGDTYYRVLVLACDGKKILNEQAEAIADTMDKLTRLGFGVSLESQPAVKITVDGGVATVEEAPDWIDLEITDLDGTEMELIEEE